MMNNFEYCPNEMPKLMLLFEGLFTTVGIYSFILWALSKRMMVLWLFAFNCNDSNCILIYTILSSNSIYPSFYFYVNSIARLSWGFSSNPCFFRKNAYGEEGEINKSHWRVSKDGPWRGRVAIRGSQDLRAFSHGDPWHVNVICEVAIAVILLFKLEIWKTLGKPYPLINYYQVINDTRTVENKN